MIHLKYDRLVCSKRFRMKSGATAFHKDKIYDIIDVMVFGKEVEYIFNSEVGKKHVMPEIDVTRHFRLKTS